ncbi:MAG: serine/threonine-protein kinase [Isosphaeraceae bacterium]
MPSHPAPRSCRGTAISSVDSSGRRLPYFRSVAQIGLQAAQGLAHAHARGVIHRDVKPSNLLLDTSGVVWIADFGLAKAQEDGLTATGDLLGTLRYMAPERFRGEGDARADIYALGLTLYELITLRPAYDSPDRPRLIEQIRSQEPRPPRALDHRIPRDLETIVLKAIDKELPRRYSTAEAMAEDLRRFLEDEPIKARPIGTSERSWRWARRNPTVASMGGAIAILLAAVTVASMLAANRFARLADRESTSAASQRSARQDAERARRAAELAEESARAEEERALRHEREAVRERKRADAMLADMFTSRGLLAGERGAPAEAALWFASAAEQSAIAGDAARQASNRMRARNWLRTAITPLAATLAEDCPTKIAFQPGGDHFLARMGNGKLRLVSLRDNGQLAWAEGLGQVEAACFHPDGRSIAIGFLGGGGQIRQVADGRVLAELPLAGPVQAVAFSRDGRSLAIADRVLRIWDTDAQAFRGPAWEHPEQVASVQFNRSGDRLITACTDRKVRVFDAGGGPGPLYDPIPHKETAPPALIDGDRGLVTITGDSQLTRWDLESGRPSMPPIRTRPISLQKVVASADGRWFAAGGYYGPELFSAAPDVPSIHLGHTNQVMDYAFSPDGSALLTVGMDQTARLWSIPEGRPLFAPLRHMASANACAWSDDSSCLATGQNDGLIRAWRRPAEDPVIAVQARWGWRPRMGDDGKLAAPGFWHESAMGIDDLATERLQVVHTDDARAAGPAILLPGTLIDSCIGGDNHSAAAIWSRDGAGYVGAWDVATGRPRFGPIRLPGRPRSIAARPGRGDIAVLCGTGDLLVFDGKAGEPLHALRHEAWTCDERSIRALYTGDGKALVSLGGADGTVNVRDADTGLLRFEPIRSGLKGVNTHSIALSPDGRYLATITLVKNTARVWDMETGRPASEHLPHPGDYWGLFGARFSPDGRRLLTFHKDGLARYWDWQAGKLACPPMYHDHEIHDSSITPDGRFAITVSSGNPPIRAWELATGRQIAPPLPIEAGDSGWCDTLSLSPDGRRAMVGFVNASLAVIEIGPLLSPASAPVEEIAVLAELATSQRIDLGDLSGLMTAEWEQRWDRRARGGPGFGGGRKPGPGKPSAGDAAPNRRPGAANPSE